MYKVTNKFMGKIPESETGLYQEFIIINATNMAIGVVDKFNNKYTIKPDKSKDPSTTIKIYVRNNVGNKSNGGLPQSISTNVCSIDLNDILSDFIYVKEIDSVICSEQNLSVCSHPVQSFSYEEALKDTIDELRTLSDLRIPTVKIVANDPSNKIKKVYCYLLDYFVEIIPTHYTTSDNGVTIIFPNDGMKTKFISFDEIEAANGLVNNPYVKCFISTNKDLILKAIEKENSSAKLYTEKEMEEAQEKFQKDFKEHIKQLEATLLQKYRVQIQELNNKVKELELENEKYKNIINSADGYLNFVGKQMNHEEKILQNRTENMKYWHSMAKITIPLVIGLITGKLLLK